MTITTGPGVSHLPTGTGDTYNVIGELITFKVTQAQTGNAFTVVEMVAQPGGGPPLHTHPSAESFTILEGEFEFTSLKDGQPKVFRAVPGDTVFIPAGDAHTYRAVGDVPGKTLLVFSPGTDMEGFFVEAGTPVSEEPPSAPDMPGLIAVAGKYGMEFLPPLGG